MMMRTRSAGPRGTWPLLRRGRCSSRWNSACCARRRSRSGQRTARASKAGPRRPLKYRPRRRPRSGTRGGRTRAASCASVSSCRSATRVAAGAEHGRRALEQLDEHVAPRVQLSFESPPAVAGGRRGGGSRRRRGESGGRRGAASSASRRRPGSGPPRRRSRGATTAWSVASSPRRRWKAGTAFLPGPSMKSRLCVVWRRS